MTQLTGPQTLEGTIRSYKGNGRKLGYPTANLSLQTELDDGVYFGYAELADWHHHPALIFVGIPTTVGDHERRVEAHLLDIPDTDYYDLPLKLNVAFFHRPNQTLNSIEELTTIMRQDEVEARRWFKNNLTS